jgi:hypothetical protein
LKGERFEAFDEVERRPLLATCLGENQGSLLEVEGGETTLLRRHGSKRLPAQAAGDHEM